MVTVTINKSNACGYYGISAKDHAEESIVCAAVSATLQGLAGTLINIEPKPHIERMILDSGDVEIEIKPSAIAYEQLVFDALFFFAEVSLMQIEKKYPQNVVVNVNNY